MTRTIPADEFQSQCLDRIDDVVATTSAVLITRHGRPVAELRPFRPDLRAKRITGARYAADAPEITALDFAAWEAMRS